MILNSLFCCDIGIIPRQVFILRNVVIFQARCMIPDLDKSLQRQ